MSQPEKQCYENHKRIPTFYIVQMLILLVAVIMGAAALHVGDLKLFASAMLFLTLAGIAGVMQARWYALTLQDRIIRLEMRVRLEKVLPDDLRGRIPELTLKQLIGLRFAADAEMANLVRKVLDERIETADAIKRLVKDWQGDHLRV